MGRMNHLAWLLGDFKSRLWNEPFGTAPKCEWSSIVVVFSILERTIWLWLLGDFKGILLIFSIKTIWVKHVVNL
ncbi:hypothetical protein RhiirB3_456786 [Rhizophagus irregularis]|nr:hypothetical protein RhiirB3_456786 [Rhizophagus irregularis]